MKNEQLMLVAALALAGYMMFKKNAPASGSLAGFAPVNPIRPRQSGGYDPADPGKFVSMDDLIAETAHNAVYGTPADLYNIPTFNQTIDDVLGIPPIAAPRDPNAWW